MSRLHRNLIAGLSLIVLPQAAAAQSLDRRVASAGDGTVQFHFAAREGVCGDGHSFYRAEEGGYYSTYNGNGNGNSGQDVCVRGPVRAVIVRAGKDVIKLETYVGPISTEIDGGHDLGAVSAKEAASYLLGLTTTLDGRAARDAIVPAMFADSAVVTPQLMALAKDPNRSRDLRRSAISWMARRRNETGGVGTAAINRALDLLVHDRNESETIRSQALSTISGFDRGEGIPTLITFAGEGDPWLSKQAFSTVARSGDPRARQFVRQAVRRTDLPEESRVSAIQGIGGDYATGEDMKLLRDLYPSLNSDRERDAILSSVANAGGNENSTWLLAIAKSQTEPLSRRKRAIALLSRSDDPGIKEALKGLVDR